MLHRKPRLPWLQSIIGIVLLGAMSSSQAAVVWVIGAPTVLYPLADGSYKIGFDTLLPSCSGTGSGGSYVQITINQNGVTSDAAKSLIATAMLAFATDAELQVAFDDSTLNCYVNRIALVK